MTSRSRQTFDLLVIGKIAGEQIIKLETLGLDEREAEERTCEDFLS